MTTSRPQRSVGASPSSLVALLELVEEMPAGATGALVVGPRSRPHGAVLLEGGRICWAAARSMRTRLTDLLLAEGADVDRQGIEQLYRRCREEGRPLGETLVDAGVVSKEGLRRCLEKHTAEALTALGTTGVEARSFHEHSRRKYDAAFTFTPTDVLRGLAPLRWRPEQVDRASALLSELVGPDGSAAAFSLDPRDELPASTLRGDHMGLRGLLRLGRWARSALLAGGALGADARMIVGRSRTDGGLIAWRREDFVIAVACPDHSAVSWIVARQGRR